MTKDVQIRFTQHNFGKERTTRPYAPFQLIFTEQCDSRLSARKREKYWKSGTGKQKLRKIRDQIT